MEELGSGEVRAVVGRDQCQWGEGGDLVAAPAESTVRGSRIQVRELLPDFYLSPISGDWQPATLPSDSQLFPKSRLGKRLWQPV